MGSCASSPSAGLAPGGASVPVLGPAGPDHTAAGAGPNFTVPGLPPRIKLVLLGDSGVGKSCLALRFTRGVFDAGSRATVGAAFSAATVTLPSGASCKFELWDTAGQERYQSLAPLYYRGSHAAVIVYDVTERATLAKAQFWLEELRRYAGQSIVLTLVGNKTDLAELRQVSEEEGRALADSIGAMFVEASAAAGANVGEVFEGVAAKLAGGLPVSVNAAATAIF